MERPPDEPLEPPTAAESQMPLGQPSSAAEPEMPPSPAPGAGPAPPPLLPARSVAALLPSRTAGGARGLALFDGIERVLDAVDAIADRIAEVTGIRSHVG